jgi:hypothetical protein
VNNGTKPDDESVSGVPDDFRAKLYAGGHNFEAIDPLTWRAVEHAHVWPWGLEQPAGHLTWTRAVVCSDTGHPGLVQIVCTDRGFHGVTPYAVGLLVTPEVARALAHDLVAASDSVQPFNDWMRASPTEG